MTEIMEYALCSDGKGEKGEKDDVSNSLSRSLGGLFGLIGTADSATSSIPNSTGGSGDIRSSQMRLAVSPVKVQWALLLADLGMLKEASAYAREVKNVLETPIIPIKQGTIQLFIECMVISLVKNVGHHFQRMIIFLCLLSLP